MKSEEVAKEQSAVKQDAQIEGELEQEMEPGVEVKQAFLPNLAALTHARVPSPAKGMSE